MQKAKQFTLTVQPGQRLFISGESNEVISQSLAEDSLENYGTMEKKRSR